MGRELAQLVERYSSKPVAKSAARYKTMMEGLLRQAVGATSKLGDTTGKLRRPGSRGRSTIYHAC
jgi:hypothetical protein